MAVVWRNLDYWKQIGEDLNCGGNGWKDRILAHHQGVVGKIKMDIHDLRLLKTCPNSKCWDDFMESFNMTYKARSTGLEERFGLCCKICCWRFHGTVLGWRKVTWQRQYSGQKWLWWVLSDFETDHTQKINLGQSSPIISNPRKACSGHWGVHSPSSWTIHFPNTGLRMVKQVTRLKPSEWGPHRWSVGATPRLWFRTTAIITMAKERYLSQMLDELFGNVFLGEVDEKWC